MEIDLLPPLDGTDGLQQQRFVELSLRSYLITQHEQLAQAWEQLQLMEPGARDADWHKRQQELAAMYEQDVGVPPGDRHELERQIETCISQGSHQTLTEVIAVVKRQSQNGSVLSVALSGTGKEVLPT